MVKVMSQIYSTTRWIVSALFGILLCGVTACSPESDRPLTGPRAVARGEQVFEYSCGYCHGTGGRGPSLAEIKSLSNTERRNKTINHPISGQIPQRLPANELSDLSEYFESE
jgi:mono/diheme cytochrome c family protein